jgi:hypothetical protein
LCFCIVLISSLLAGRSAVRSLCLGRFWFFDLVAFAGGKEEVGFEAVLAGVEVVVTAA